MDVVALLASLAPSDGTYPWQSGDAWTRLISEVLLSRTRRTVVARVYPSLVEMWPTPDELSRADPSEVWEVTRPTGFRRRADRLVAIASAVIDLGDVPSSRDELLALPGVGEYSADTIRLLAFDGERMPLDMNIDRVVSRLAGVAPTARNRSPYSNEALVSASAELMHGSLAKRRAVFTGLLELSASVCRPRPLCDECPLPDVCEFATSRRASEVPGGQSGGEES